MAILVVLMLLVPALISVLLYERFKGCDLGWVKRTELFLILAFLINMGVYAVFWVRGWEVLIWNLAGDSHIYVTSFVVQYMVLSLIASVVLAYVLSLVRIEKSRREASEQDNQEDAALPEQTETEI